MDLLTNNRLGLALALSLVVAACASPTIPDDGNLAGDGSGASTASKKTPSTSNKTPTKSDTAPAESDPSTATGTPAPATTPTTPASTAQCAGQAPDACFDCCNQASGGALAPADNVYGQCACGGGQCSAVCDANLCSGAAADAACSSCLQATCAPAEAAACTSAACKAGLACAMKCN